ncbi:Putative RNA methylase family UPF0020 [Polynucleobacter kasalickyi]|uniref:Putative RNA methylase family UPF0020 n=2 Tax=Polynucleobacter kasalickyi TaxID=1938817 RepID=A0A1W2A822_9BURK|nr:Putative RNA methylase family UPF0020 [Polynucleobacter kasalickyi]
MDEEELQQLGLSKPEAIPLAKSIKNVFLGDAPIKPSGGIEVSGTLGLAMAINLHSRIASRVLLQLIHCPYKKEDDIYKVTKGLSWEDWFDVSQTIRVDVTAQRSNLQSLNFITLRIKDAVCDRFRDLCGERPSIETGTPDVRIMAFLDATHISIYLDTSGEALFKRGWRDEKGAAPLKENLAAGILAFTGWQAKQPLYDPMCGSGTFLIEAAQIARHIPPGAIRAGLMEELEPEDQGVEPVRKAYTDTLLNDVDTDADADADADEDEEIQKESLSQSAQDTPQAVSEEQSASTKPVWSAPILVDSGKPLEIKTTPQDLMPIVPKRVQKAEPEDASRTSKSRFEKKGGEAYFAGSNKTLKFKPSRVDLVGVYQGFGFLRLKPFQTQPEKELWGLLKKVAQLEMQRYQEVPLQIAGSDINEQMIRVVRHNWRMARLPGQPNVRQVDALMVKSPFKSQMSNPGVMLFNPPYGERIELKGGRGARYEEDTYEVVEPEKKMRGARDPLPKNFTDPAFVDFLSKFGRHLKEEFAGWQIDILTADMGLPGQMRMKETKRTPLFNGSIECRLFRFEIREFQKRQEQTPIQTNDPTES